jgi:DNA repair protein RecO (recombination protein O)
MSFSKVELQSAYILHSRNYRDTSLLVEALTPEYGRVSLVVKGVRASSKAAQQKRSLIQPLQRLLMSWQGKSDLKTLVHVESATVAVPLVGKRLFSAFYINELLTRLLHHYHPHPELFELYEWCIQHLQDTEFIDVVLRRFELLLLEQLGYGIHFDHEAGSEQPLSPENVYQFDSERGFLAVAESSPQYKTQFYGRDLLDLATNDFRPEVRQAAKRLCRLALEPHLGSKPLKSRELFV